MSTIREWCFWTYKNNALVRMHNYFEATTLEALEELAAYRAKGQRAYLFQERYNWYTDTARHGVETVGSIGLPSGQRVSLSEALDAMQDEELYIGENTLTRKGTKGTVNGLNVYRAVLSYEQSTKLWRSADKLSSVLADHGVDVQADDGFYYTRLDEEERIVYLAHSWDGQVSWDNKPDDHLIQTLIEAHGRLSGLYLDMNRIY